jgi:predicted acylesterase/phospholipase RssA
MWDVISGVSAGALNGGGVASFTVGKEKEMIEFLENLWRTMEDSKVW